MLKGFVFSQIEIVDTVQDLKLKRVDFVLQKKLANNLVHRNAFWEVVVSEIL